MEQNAKPKHILTFQEFVKEMQSSVGDGQSPQKLLTYNDFVKYREKNDPEYKKFMDKNRKWADESSELLKSMFGDDYFSNREKK